MPPNNGLSPSDREINEINSLILGKALGDSSETEMVPCRRCDGTGRYTCSFYQCPECGHIETKSATCPECKGAGKVAAGSHLKNYGA